MTQQSQISPTKRFLVLARVGDSSLHSTWLGDGSVARNWDLQLNSYGKEEARFQDGDLPPVFDYGTKWDSIVRHLRAHPELLDHYDYIMLPDDDLLMEASGLNRFFEIAVEHDLTLAQPAMTLESYISYPILLRMPRFRLRYSTYLESMACCMKTSYLRTLLPMFERHFTGWGTDLIWATLMEDPAFRAAIVDEVPMTHTRPLYTGPLYKSYALGIDPEEELRTIPASFENLPRGMQIYGGYLADGRRVGAFRSRILNGIGLLAAAGRSRAPFISRRMAFALFLRSLTMFGYRPEQLRAIAGTEMAEFGLGAPPSSRPSGEPEGKMPSALWRDTAGGRAALVRDKERSTIRRDLQEPS